MILLTYPKMIKQPKSSGKFSMSVIIAPLFTKLQFNPCYKLQYRKCLHYTSIRLQDKNAPNADKGDVICMYNMNVWQRCV